MFCLSQINRSYQRGYYEKVQTFIVKLIRYTFWQYVTEFLLHFIYVNAIQYHPQVMILIYLHKILYNNCI